MQRCRRSKSTSASSTISSVSCGAQAQLGNRLGKKFAMAVGQVDQMQRMHIQMQRGVRQPWRTKFRQWVTRHSRSSSTVRDGARSTAKQQRRRYAVAGGPLMRSWAL